MRVCRFRPFPGVIAWLVGIAILVPSFAAAQVAAPVPSTRAIGEEYRIELSGGLWNPSVFGTIAVTNDRIEAEGTTISFVDDLGFKQTQFGDVRLVLRPAKKHKFRVQYTPVSYSAESTFSREIIFNGILYPVNMPVNSTFDWKVWRFGYEYDFVYRDRWYVGLLLEARYTEMSASLQSPVNNEFTRARAPLPALGLVTRVYPLPNLSLTAEISGMKVPDIEEYKAHYADIDVYATFNFMHNFGVQAGWRRMNTFLQIEGDKGDIKFSGLWFGGAARF
jgi:hypothetical protein